MFLRIVQARVLPGRTDDVRSVYDADVIPTLASTPGCVFACLLRGSGDQDHLASLTLWETQDDAEAYERKGTFVALMKKVSPYLSEASESRMQLSKDLTLELSPDDAEPTVSRYPVSIDLPAKQRLTPGRANMYLRIVSVHLKKERRDEYHSLYINEIIPTLQQADGCLHVYLVMPPSGSNESLSLTVWESKDHADRYEATGAFARLVDRVKHTFTDLVQWKLDLDPEQRSAAASSEEVRIEGYTVISSRDFGPRT